MSKSFGLNNKYPLSQSQWRVQLSGVPVGINTFYFTEFNGIKDKAEKVEYADPTSNRIFNLTGPRKVEEFTLKVPFVPEIHTDLINWWKVASCHDVSLNISAIRCDDAYDENGIEASVLAGANESDNIWPNAAGVDTNQQSNSFNVIILDAKCKGVEFAEVNKTAAEVSMFTMEFVYDTYSVDNQL